MHHVAVIIYFLRRRDLLRALRALDFFFFFFAGLCLRRFPVVLNSNLAPRARNALRMPRASLGFFAVNVFTLAITKLLFQITRLPDYQITRFASSRPINLELSAVEHRFAGVLMD
jgi:hypothetical protein